MKRIIDISEEVYTYFKKFWLDGVNENRKTDILVNALRNSTPLNEVEAENCISRSVLIERFKNTESSECCTWTLAGVIDEINDIPSVYPKNDKPSGKWIVDKYKATLTCSECDKHYTQFPVISWKPQWNYCPNCGAKMESEE